MSYSLNIFNSNRVEQLYVYLKHALYSDITHPFTRRLVAVASPALKNWLMLRLAQDPDLGIAAGLEIGSLDDLVQKLRMGFCLKSGYKKIPSLTELGLAIEVEIRRILTEWDFLSPQQQKLYSSLACYLEIDKQGSLSKKSEKRLLGLSLEVAELFLQYGKYGYGMVSTWSGPSESEAHWQQNLWNRLFNPDSPWTYLSKELCEHRGFANVSHLQVNLFSIGYLPPAYHRYFEQLSAACPVNYYILSPCQHFWSDILSDREAHWLVKSWREKGRQESQLDALEDFLRDRNPLLANYGRIGREMAQLIESHSSNIHEHYFAPHAALDLDLGMDIIPHYTECYAGNSLTLLQGIQTDMLVLRNPLETPKINLRAWDQSIQIHSSCSKYREVQALYNTLMGLIQTHAHDADPITPADIIVMAPDINEYAPYIRRVFESQESVLSIQIMDLQVPAQNPSLQAFMHLISLASSRWDVLSVLKLLDFPVFSKKNKLEKEDLYEIKEWILKAEIRWGNNAQHRESLIVNDYEVETYAEQSAVGTWEFGISRLLSGLVYAEGLEPGLYQGVDPLPLENSKAELLSAFIRLLKALREDLKPLSDVRKMSLKEWGGYLRELYEQYFDLGDDEESGLILEEIFAALGSAAKYFAQQKFSFATIKKHIEGLLNAKKTTYRDSRLNAVKFCALLPMRTIPAKVIALLGLHEGAYPRREINKSLNLMIKHPQADYRPSQTDFDRYLFLEALLSARRYFIMSYLAFTEDDFKEQNPSLVVMELLDYLDKAYEIQGAAPSKFCYFKHPFLAFHKDYFNADSILKSYSKREYLLASAYYNAEKQAGFKFIPAISLSARPQTETLSQACFQEDTGQQTAVLGLNQLNAFAKNPLKIYLNKKLGIYLPRQEGKVLEVEEPLLLSYLKIDDLKKQSLKKSLEAISAYAHQKGFFAPGIYKDIALKDLEDKIAELHDNLNYANIRPEELFDIEFSDDHLCARRKESGEWCLPALTVQSSSGKNVKISGRIKNVSPQGLLEHAKDKSDIAKIWPRFLIFHTLVQQHHLPIEPHMVFAKNGEVKKPFFLRADAHLGSYLDYYFTSLDWPSPLIPEWVPIFIKEDAKTLQDKLKETLNDNERFFNEYAVWLFRGDSLPEDIAAWKPVAHSLFEEAFDSWFSSKKSS